MPTVVRHHEDRDRDAAREAYRRGREAYQRSAGAMIVNPFLPGTQFQEAFDLGVAAARDSVLQGTDGCQGEGTRDAERTS